MVQNNGQSMGSEQNFDFGPEGSKFNVTPLWVQMKAESVGQRSSGIRSRLSDIEASNRGNSDAEPDIFQSAIHDNEEYWRPPTRPKPPNAKSTYGRTYKWDLRLISAEWPAGRIF
ncbi:hypothetical protein AYI69_g6903 [Smittium culicis]|uniref:Uncharacterized protein n=1 Tax=Smittium culicis TaxID=133412 RepID=A0A1R1XVP1_9FUNG|nr:hypothetical protein AYI69_g6903 [Smittium culicis]